MTYDVVVYGDSCGAVTAAVAAKREGRSVILVNPTGFLGGMSASGLGATDFLGQRATFGGIASEFYDLAAAAYGVKYVRSFEPHVGQQAFEKLNRTPGKGVKKKGRRITAITTLSGKTYQGKMFIDATYVGDLMAAAGVRYTVGREPESQYGENMAGVRRGDTKPVFMTLSQSAALAAGLALDKKIPVQDVGYPELRERLDAAKQIVDNAQVPKTK